MGTGFIIYRTDGRTPVDFAAWRRWGSLARSFGLDALELLLVVELARGGGTLSRAAVSEALAVDASELSRLINRAEEDELVLRVSGSDRRCISLELLERGWDVSEEVLDAADGTEPAGETLVACCLAINRQLRAVRRDCALTFSQAVCLVAVMQLGLRLEDPSAATKIEQLTGTPRTTARTALSQLALRGI